MNFVVTYLKSHFAALGTALSLVIADLNAGHLTINDWYGVIGAALGVGVVVATVPNAAKAATAAVSAQDSAAAK